MTVRILAVCGNGQGSSMIMKMKVDQFLTQSNIDHTVNSCAVGEYKSELSGADIIIASTHIAGEISVTGGLALEDLPLFKGIPIHVFIAGRSIRDAESPVEAARQFKRSIAQLWG